MLMVIGDPGVNGLAVMVMVLNVHTVQKSSKLESVTIQLHSEKVQTAQEEKGKK